MNNPTNAPSWSDRADALSKALHLAIAPIGIRFSQKLPEGVEPFADPSSNPEPSEDGRTGAVSAGCVFWMHATDRTFSTVPADHANCSVGSYTHGLISGNEVMAGGDVAALLRSGWITTEQTTAIPQVSDRPEYITYGPLSDATDDPDVVLMRVNGRQMMELADALPGLEIEGKPQCHIIALAYNETPAASVGCALSRVRTGMPPTEMTAALPVAALDETIDRLQTTDEINDNVSRYAAQDSRRFAS